MHRLTRISFNSADWRHPTGEAGQSESAETYNRKYGFGHEDWLFRSDWVIDGWRYGFVQGVNKSHASLVEAGEPTDLTLFTIEPDKRRRYVATIEAVECLNDQQADDALEAFKLRGWHDAMREEIEEVNGDSSALGAVEWAKHLLNVRFRLANVRRFPADAYAAPDDPIHSLNRYQLYNPENLSIPDGDHPDGGNTGSRELPKTAPFVRAGSASVECTPEHARMQKRLMQELQVEYPEADVVREEAFVDVRVRTPNELILFEIKSDLEPRTVLREALGQILEYAFHPRRQHPLTPRLVIVGRRALSPHDEAYLSRLKADFRLPIEYRVVSL